MPTEATTEAIVYIKIWYYVGLERRYEIHTRDIVLLSKTQTLFELQKLVKQFRKSHSEKGSKRYYSVGIAYLSEKMEQSGLELGSLESGELTPLPAPTEGKDQPSNSGPGKPQTNWSSRNALGLKT